MDLTEGPTSVFSAQEFPVNLASRVKPWWDVCRSTDTFQVYRVNLAPNESFQALAYSTLDREEQDRWQSYFPTARRRFALCRSALRSILCQELGCANHELHFGASSYGKPYAIVGGIDAPVEFNVSHSGNHGLIALGRGYRLGIDLEEFTTERKLPGLIEAVMGPEEQAELADLPDSEALYRFYRLWTCKEALVKALGTGFSTDISRFQVPADLRLGRNVGTFRFPDEPDVVWRLEYMGNKDYAAALAYEILPARPMVVGQAG